MRKCREATIITTLVNRLFVYGTLRLGSSNEYALTLASSARFIGHGHVRGRMLRVARYPGLVAPATETDWVKGDLFENLSDEMLRRLDDYEGPDYSRVLSEIRMDDGQKIAAYVYYYAMPVQKLEPIPTGDWFDVTVPPSLPE